MKTTIALLGLCVAMFAADATAGVARHPWSEWKNTPKSETFFPIGVWAQNPADAGRYKALGVNYYFALHGGPNAGQMAQLRKHGMAAICGLNEYAEKNLLDEPLIWGWMHGDEPDLAHVYSRDALRTPEGKARLKAEWPEMYAELKLDTKEYQGWGMGANPKNIQADYKRIRNIDPTRPVFLQLSKAVALDGKFKGRGSHSGNVEIYPEYMKGSDIVSFDIYPVAYGKPGQLWLVPKGLDQLRKWGAGDRPVMAILEAGFGDKAQANYHQQRAQAWMAINHGATSICWFCHRWATVEGKNKMISTKMPLYDKKIGDAVKAINEEIHSLAAVINTPPLKAEDVVVTGAKLDISARIKDGAVYIFAVERGNDSPTATIAVKDVKNAKVYVLGEDRTLELTKGIFTDSFKPFDTHLYKIVK